jgi:pimeloyl-ACP methyl ester carboxylesterase
MAVDMAKVMAALGFSEFAVAGHDRGGRVAYCLALDHPERVTRVAVLDVLPTELAWKHADANFTLGYWPWSRSNTCGIPASVRRAPMRRLCEIQHTLTQSAKSIAPARRWIGCMTRQISIPDEEFVAHCWHFGARAARSIHSINLNPARSPFGASGPTTCRGKPSKAGTFSPSSLLTRQRTS